jgi:hypothetical protein
LLSGYLSSLKFTSKLLKDPKPFIQSHRKILKNTKKIKINKKNRVSDDASNGAGWLMDCPGLVGLWRPNRIDFGPWFFVSHSHINCKSSIRFMHNLVLIVIK